MVRYNTLLGRVGYLENVTLKLSAANGVTAADLRAAEENAGRVIAEALSRVYETAAWEKVTPGLVERIADMLSSAEVLRRKYRRGDISPGDDEHLPAVLDRDGRALLAMLKRGALPLFARSGRVQERLVRGRPRRGRSGGRAALRAAAVAAL